MTPGAFAGPGAAHYSQEFSQPSAMADVTWTDGDNAPILKQMVNHLEEAAAVAVSPFLSDQTRMRSYGQSSRLTSLCFLRVSCQKCKK